VAEQRPRHASRMRVELVEQVASLLGDFDLHHSSIRLASNAPDQSALREPINESGDIGITGDRSLAYLTTRQRLCAAAKDAQDVVLAGAQALGGLQELGPRRGDTSCRHANAKKGLLLGGVEGPVLLELGGERLDHGNKIDVATNIVKRMISGAPLKRRVVETVAVGLTPPLKS